MYIMDLHMYIQNVISYFYICFDVSVSLDFQLRALYVHVYYSCQVSMSEKVWAYQAEI